MPWTAPALALIILMTNLVAQQRLELAAPFGDHMVLQRDRQVVIYGRAPRRAPVTVEFGGQERTTNADRDGAWSVALEPMPANAEPRTLVVDCFGAVEFKDVLVGDVWFCAGQSNMRFAVKSSSGGKEAIAAGDRPSIRLLDFRGRLYPSRKKYSMELLRSIDASNYYQTKGWQRCSPKTVGSFSAVAYWFGAKLSRELKVPIGLIHNAIGGVPMETYIPREAMAADAKLRRMLDKWWENPEFPAWCRQRGGFNLSAWTAKQEGSPPHHPFEPGFLFDAGVRPFVASSIKGVLWYQGESNATVDGGLGAPVVAEINRHKLKTMIRSWRAAWARPNLPFYMAQLPGLNRKWAPFREAQWQVAAESPHTGCAVTLDVGHPTNVHPKNKKPVGERLALLALRDTYGKEIVAEGPVFQSFERDGRRLLLRFANAKGLNSTDGEPLRCFVVAGEDRKFHQASAKIDGDRVVVESGEVATPVAVRYAWQSDPPVNLVNAAVLPAAPFRTDTWAGRKER